MNKLDKILLFKDLEEINNNVNIKKEKLQIIIDLFLDEIDSDQKEDIDDKLEPEYEMLDDDGDEDTIDFDYSKTIERENLSNNQVLELPPNIKSIFNRVVKITHPDKIKNEQDRDIYIQYYQRVVDAKELNNKHEILYVAYLLGIKEIYELSDDDLGSIKKRIKELEMESRLIDNNSFWVCYYTNDKDLKKQLVKQILKVKGFI